MGCLASKCSFESVTTGRRILDRLTSPPLNLGHDEGVARLQGTLVGPDGRQTAVLLTLTEHGQAHLHEMLAAIYRAAESQCGLAPGALYLGGPPVTTAAIDVEAERSLRVPVLLSGLVGMLFSWRCFRTARLTLLVTAIGAYSAVVALAVVWLTGTAMNAILLMLAPLVYVSTTSGAIHLANYYREEVAAGGLAGAIGRAVDHARLPLTLATSTTAAGLLSLCISNLLPIRHFGVYAAIGVAASLAWLVVLFPAALSAWRPSRDAGPRDPTLNTEPSFATGQGRWWQAADTITRRNLLVSAACLAVLVAAGLGLPRVRTSVDLDKYFSRQTDIVRWSNWLENNLCPIVPLELVVRVQTDRCTLTPLERLELVDHLQRSVRQLEAVGGSMSAVTFAPRLDERPSGRWSIRRSVLNQRIERSSDRFVQAGFLALDGQEQLWRISLRVRSFHRVNYRDLLATIQDQVEPLIPQGQGITVAYTGMVPLFCEAQQLLLEGLILGLVTDVAVIVLAIIVIMRHWSIGLVMLITTTFPSVIVLGLMGWSGVAIDIGTALAPSIAVGVTVDDVLHFVLWFRRGVARGLPRPAAVRLAYAGCARAMYQSWGVIGIGLLVLAISSFTPTQGFGMLMAALLTVALLGNLVLLPALLAGPLGAAFARRRAP